MVSPASVSSCQSCRANDCCIVDWLLEIVNEHCVSGPAAEAAAAAIRAQTKVCLCWLDNTGNHFFRLSYTLSYSLFLNTGRLRAPEYSRLISKIKEGWDL